MPHPVRKLGRVGYVTVPILPLDFVQARCRLAAERDLSASHGPISGRDRKAHGRAQAAQDALRRVPKRLSPRFHPERAYGSYEVPCDRCRHVMYLDEVPHGPVRCDRCKRTFET